MVFINNPFYATVWSVETLEKRISMRISTGEKQQDGTWKDSNWWVVATGHAFNALKDKVQQGDRIRVNKAKITNELYVNKDGDKRSKFNFVLIDADVVESKKTTDQTPAQETRAAEEDSPW